MLEEARPRGQARRSRIAGLVISWLALAALGVCAHASAPPTPLVQVAEGIFVSAGAPGEADTENRGEIATVGFVAGRTSAIAVDTGASVGHAARLERAFRSQGLGPVTVAVNTAGNAERVFGNGHYAERSLYAHPEAARLIRERCSLCLERLQRELGPQVMAGTTLVVPRLALRHGTRLRAGDREVEVLDFGWSASPGAIALWDPMTRTLFAGALAAFARVPEVRDARLDAWLAAIDLIIAMEPKVIVPGWGPPGLMTDLRAMRGYLLALQARVADLLDRNVGLVDAPAQADLAEYRDWPLYGSRHRRNVHDLYVAMERDRFDRDRPGPKAASGS
jgi:glyoxylase-like metal-dependent hydrolase (beta-lactamase superfamily II)